MNKFNSANPKLVIFCLTSSSGGIDRVIGSLLSFPPDREIYQFLICRDLPNLFENMDRFSWVVTKKYSLVRRFGHIWPFADIKIMHEIKILAASTSPVIVNPHDYLSLYYSFIAKKLLRANIIIIPTVHQLANTLPINQFKKRLYGIIDRFVFQQVDGIIAISKERKEQLMQYMIPSNNIRVIYNGVDVDLKLPTQKEILDARRTFQIPENKICIGFGGRLSVEKGPQVLIQALNLLPSQQIEKLYVLIAGSGPMEAILRKSVQEKELDQYVKFVGFIEDMQKFYHSIDVLIQPSLEEGLSMTVLEAMNSGKPVIASRAGGNPEVVIDGKTGWLLDVGNPKALAWAITEAMQNPEEMIRRGRKGKREVQRLFSIKTMIHMTYDYIMSFNNHENRY